MIKLIIGQNASGKTLYLNNLIQSRLEKTDRIDFVTNTIRNITFINKPYNTKRLEILKELTLADEINTSSSENISPIGNPVRLSNRFLYLMTILCKDVKLAYLDEPEQGLSEYEKTLLVSYLQLSDDTFDELVIVTHSEMLVNLPHKEIYTVEMSKDSADVKLIPVPEDKKYEFLR